MLGRLTGDEYGLTPRKIGQVLLQGVVIQVPAVAGELCVIEVGLPIVAKVATVDEDQLGTAVVCINTVFELMKRTVGFGRCTHGESTGRLFDNNLSVRRSVGVGRPARLTFWSGYGPPYLVHGGWHGNFFADFELVRHVYSPVGEGTTDPAPRFCMILLCSSYCTPS